MENILFKPMIGGEETSGEGEEELPALVIRCGLNTHENITITILEHNKQTHVYYKLTRFDNEPDVILLDKFVKLFEENFLY